MMLSDDDENLRKDEPSTISYEWQTITTTPEKQKQDDKELVIVSTNPITNKPFLVSRTINYPTKIGTAAPSISQSLIPNTHSRTSLISPFQVLYSPSGTPTANLWVPCSNGSFPSHAFIAGRDSLNFPVYVARIKIDEFQLSASLIPRFRSAVGAFRGLQYARSTYEVLTTSNKELKPCTERLENEPTGEECTKVVDLDESKSENENEKDEDDDDEKEKENENENENESMDEEMLGGLKWTKGLRDGISISNPVISGLDEEGNEYHIIRHNGRVGVLKFGNGFGLVPDEKCVVSLPVEEYDVLCNPYGTRLSWRTACLGDIHKNAFCSSKGVYVGRIYGYLSSSVMPKRKRAFSVMIDDEHGYGGVYCRMKYQVLCVDDDKFIDSNVDDEKRIEENMMHQYQNVSNISNDPVDKLWVSCVDGEIPEGSVIVNFDPDGLNGGHLYIARSTARMGIVVGGVKRSQPAIIPYQKTGKMYSRYQVFTSNEHDIKLKWVKARGGVLPKDAIVAGHTTEQDRIYIARGKLPGREGEGWKAGKLIPRCMCAFVVSWTNGEWVESVAWEHEILCTGEVESCERETPVQIHREQRVKRHVTIDLQSQHDVFHQDLHFNTEEENVHVGEDTPILNGRVNNSGTTIAGVSISVIIWWCSAVLIFGFFMLLLIFILLSIILPVLKAT